MTPLVFYKVAFGGCLLLLFVAHAALAVAQKKGDKRQIRVLHLLGAGLSLSAASYLLRLMEAPHHGPFSFFSFVTCFMGTMFLWLGWMEHWNLRGERLNVRFAPRDEEDEPAVIAFPFFAPTTGSPPLTARACQVLHHAQQEAHRRHECCLDTEHLLLGLLHDPGSAGVHVLDILGANPEKVHLGQLGQMASSRKFTRESSRTPDVALGTEAGPPTLTERAVEVLTLAAQEAQRFDETSIGTEHLLLGLVLAGKGKAAAVLFGEGITVDGIRAEIIIAKKAL